jgi:hypothetical protein
MIRCAGQGEPGYGEPLSAVAGAEIGMPAADASFTVSDQSRTGASHLAQTGSRVGPLSEGAAAALGLGVIVLGVIAVVLVHERRRLMGAHGVTVAKGR